MCQRPVIESVEFRFLAWKALSAAMRATATTKPQEYPQDFALVDGNIKSPARSIR
jgi:hypothetical protein